MTTPKAALAAACFLALSAGGPAALAQTVQQDKQPQRAQQSQGAMQQAGKPAKQDRQALQRLAETDLAEVKLGQLGQDKGQSEEVKKFAEHMVEAHGKALEQKREMAEKMGVDLPDEPTRKHQATLDKLQKLEGAKFDRQYMEAMVKGHQAALKEARKAAKNAKDPQVQAAAEKAAKEIEQHLDRAKTVQASLGGAARGSGRAEGAAGQNVGEGRGPGGAKAGGGQK